MSNIKTLVFLILYAFTWHAFGEETCARFYSQKDIVYAKRPLLLSDDYNPNGLLPKNTLWGHIEHYIPSGLTYKTAETRLIDQKFSKECPTFAFVHAMESAYANHPTHPEVVEFNTELLIAKKLKRYIEKAIDPDDSFFTYEDPFAPMREGGDFYNVLEVIFDDGLAPVKRWVSKKQLGSWPFLEGIPNEPTLYKMIEKRVDDENYRIVNNIEAAPRKNDPKYKAWKSNFVEKIFQDIVGESIGAWPKPFEWNGIYNLSTVDFSKMYGPSRTLIPKLIYMTPFPYEKYNDTKRANDFFRQAFPSKAEKFKHHQSNLKSFLLAISEAIAEGKGIVIDMNGRTAGFGHAFAVTDVEVRNGIVVAIKLKNSYTNWGINGYGWISADEVFNTTRRAWIFDVIHKPK